MGAATMEEITMYYHIDCGTSNQVLELIRQKGFEPKLIDYVQNPIGAEKLQDLLDLLGLTPRELLKTSIPLYKELDLEDPDLSQEYIFKQIVDHPILMNRPIVITSKGAKLCRPAELVLDLLP